MATKEAKARIKINKLLENAGWRFFDDENGKANISLEPNVTLEPLDDDFNSIAKGFVDYLLLDERGFPLIVLEAKKEEKNPLDGKEQARRYAQSQKVRFVILSNGNIHYFWDLEYGNPTVITEFPTLESIKHRATFSPNNRRLSDEKIDENYIALTQKTNILDEPKFLDPQTKHSYITENSIRLLRPYQIRAIEALQSSA